VKNNKNGISKIIAALAITCLHAFSVNAEVKMHRGDSDTNSFPGGIWDFNYTAKWLAEGSTTPTVWDSNSDTALIVNTTTAWGNLEITIDDTYGNVGAAGIVITNNLKEWQYNKFIGDSLHIGSEGVTVYDDNPNTFVTFECPVVLTDAQTWHNPKLRQMDVSGTVTASGVVSSEAGKDTPITFSGFNRIDPSLKGMSVERPAFAFKNDNTYTGDTIIDSGGVLYLLFSNDFPGSKIDPESDLILSGGGLAITGEAQVFTQSVSRLVIKAGENFIGGKNADAVFDCGEIVRDGLGGTITFPISWAGGTLLMPTIQIQMEFSEAGLS
jgi:hypothetical protein